MTPALALAGLLVASPQGSVSLPLELWSRLQPAAPESDAPPAGVISRSVAVGEGPQRSIEAEWLVRYGQDGWFSPVLAGPEVRVLAATWDGEPARLRATPDGYVLAQAATPGDHRLTLTATVDGDRLLLLAAPAGEVAIEGAATLGGAVPAGPRRWWTGAAELLLVPPAPVSAGSVVLADVGIGLTVGDEVVRGRALVRLWPRRGTIESAELDLDVPVDDLTLAGPGLRAWRRSGGRLFVELGAPTADPVPLLLTWTSAIAGDRVPIPRLRPHGTSGATTLLSLARDGDRELLPELPGWTPRSRRSLPSWADGLVDGSAVFAFETSEPPTGGLSVPRFEPLAAPPLVIDVADLELAAAEQGPALLRARYEVRSDRAPALTVRLPEGAVPLSVRVDGQTSAAARAPGPGLALRVPLRRSVESPQGLISYPVELAMLLPGPAWQPGRRVIDLPTVDADVAVVHTTVHLPPGFAPRGRIGAGGRVARFTRGTEVSFGFGHSPEDRARAALAGELLQEAVAAWKDNDFDGVRDRLDSLDQLGAKNDNTGRLRANLDALAGDASSPLERRLRETARARAGRDRAAYESTADFAEQRARLGDWKAVAQATESALASGEALAALEEDASVEIVERQSRLLELQKRSKEANVSPEEADDARFGYGEPTSGTTFGFGAGGGGYGSGMGRAASKSLAASPAVRASTASILVPRRGRTALFQRLLQPPGARTDLVLAARRIPPAPGRR